MRPFGMNTWPNDTFNYNRQSQLAVRNSYNSSQESQHQYNWNRYSQNTYPCSQEKISNMPREYQRSTYPDQGTDRHPLCRCPVSIVPEKQMNDPRKVIGPPNRTASSPGNPWPKITGVYTLNESGKEKEHSSHENNGVNNRNEGPINANTRNYPRENYLLEPPIIDKCPTSYELQHVQQMRYQQIQQERMAEQYRMEQSQYASQHGPRMPLSSPQIINSDPRIRASGPQFTQNFERMPHSSPQASQSIPRIPTSAVKSTVQRTGILESHLRQNVYRMPYTSQQANQQIPPKLSHPNFYPSRPQEMNKSYISNINQRQNQNQNNEKRLVCTCKTPWPTEKPIVRTANIMQPGSVTNLYREQYGTDTCSANHEFTRSRIRETLALRNTQKLLRSYRSESGPSLNVLKNVPSRNDSDNLPTPWSGCGNNNVERGHSFEIRKEKPFQRDGNPLIVNVDSVSQELSINGKDQGVRASQVIIVVDDDDQDNAERTSKAEQQKFEPSEDQGQEKASTEKSNIFAKDKPDEISSAIELPIHQEQIESYHERSDTISTENEADEGRLATQLPSYQVQDLSIGENSSMILKQDEREEVTLEAQLHSNQEHGDANIEESNKTLKDSETHEVTTNLPLPNCEEQDEANTLLSNENTVDYKTNEVTTAVTLSNGQELERTHSDQSNHNFAEDKTDELAMETELAYNKERDEICNKESNMVLTGDETDEAALAIKTIVVEEGWSRGSQRRTIHENVSPNEVEKPKVNNVYLDKNTIDDRHESSVDILDRNGVNDNTNEMLLERNWTDKTKEINNDLEDRSKKMEKLQNNLDNQFPNEKEGVNNMEKMNHTQTTNKENDVNQEISSDSTPDQENRKDTHTLEQTEKSTPEPSISKARKRRRKNCYPWDKTNRSKAKKRSRILYDKDKNNNEQELIEDESNLNICQKDLNNNNDGDNCIRDKSQQSSTTFKGDCCHKENDEVSRSICETMEMSTEKKGDTSVDDSMEISEGNVQSTTKDINVLTENSKEDNRISVRNTDERKSILNEDNDMSTRSIGVQITTVPISKVSSLCSHHLKKPSNPIAILDTSEKNGDYKIICDNIFKSSDTTAVVNLSEKKRYPKVLCDDILKSPCPTANLDASEKKEEPKILSENISELSSLTTNVSAEECKSNITEKTGVRNGSRYVHILPKPSVHQSKNPAVPQSKHIEIPPNVNIIGTASSLSSGYSGNIIPNQPHIVNVPILQNGQTPVFLNTDSSTASISSPQSQQGIMIHTQTQLPTVNIPNVMNVPKTICINANPDPNVSGGFVSNQQQTLNLTIPSGTKSLCIRINTVNSGSSQPNIQQQQTGNTVIIQPQPQPQAPPQPQVQLLLQPPLPPLPLPQFQAPPPNVTISKCSSYCLQTVSTDKIVEIKQGQTDTRIKHTDAAISDILKLSIDKSKILENEETMQEKNNNPASQESLQVNKIMETVIKQWQEIQSDSIRIVDADGKTHNLIIAGSENAEQKTDYNSNSVEMSKDSNELAQERVHTSCDLKTPDKEQTQDLISQKRQVEKTQTENVELNTVKDINSQEIRTTTERKLTDSDQNPEVYPLPEPMEQGRPNGRKHKVRYHLWEFLRDILFNEKYCPEYIEWTDKSTGEFRLNDWNFVADLWGRAKSDRCLSMDYAKMSRAIRYYKKTNILTRVRRLTFRFSEEIMPQIKAPSTMHSLVIK